MDARSVWLRRVAKEEGGGGPVPGLVPATARVPGRAAGAVDEVVPAQSPGQSPAPSPVIAETAVTIAADATPVPETAVAHAHAPARMTEVGQGRPRMVATASPATTEANPSDRDPDRRLLGATAGTGAVALDPDRTPGMTRMTAGAERMTPGHPEMKTTSKPVCATHQDTLLGTPPMWWCAVQKIHFHALDRARRRSSNYPRVFLVCTNGKISDCVTQQPCLIKESFEFCLE